MFERFSTEARRVVVVAQEEARVFRHDHVGPEHILLGLVSESETVAAKALESLGITLEAVSDQVEQTIGEGEHFPTGNIAFNPGAKRVLELSLSEARELGHSYIGTEHLLLALLTESGDGGGVDLIASLGVDHDDVRGDIVGRLSA